MLLHDDRRLFSFVLDTIAGASGIEADILEKDYYVSLLLKELAEMQNNGLKAYFKGGTALYKTLKAVNRFSEDIDLSVDTRNVSRSQSKTMLERATKHYTGLPRVHGKGQSLKSSITTYYTYEPVTDVSEKRDVLERFGNVMIEATSFTISEPTESMLMAPMLYELANEEQKSVLAEKYSIKPFSIQTISLERIFVDKLFAAEAYLRRSKQEVDAAKHIYDLAVLANNERIVLLLKDENLLGKILAIRMKEELDRLDGIPNVLPKEFTFFDDKRNSTKEGFERMQRLYVIDSRHRIEFDVAMGIMKELKQRLEKNVAWTECRKAERD